jgi:hypothetical protein
MKHTIKSLGQWLKSTCLTLLCAQAASAQSVVPPRPEIDADATAIRCELRSWRAPEAAQPFYFYISDNRRTVFETDGNSLGNVVQFSRQRIVVSKNSVEGGTRTYVFDRMVGALTIAMPVTQGAREPWSISGECQRVDASRQKY